MAMGGKLKLRVRPDAGPPPAPAAERARTPSRWEALRPARGLLLGLLLAGCAWLLMAGVWLLLR